MTKRKYANFILYVDDYDFFETDNWQSVFKSYQRHESATIYGLPNYDGANYEVIMSKPQ